MRSEWEANRAIDRYADLVRRVCMIHLKNHADTEDIFQTVFLKYVTGTTEFESEEHEKAWFIRVTINACKDLLRSFFRSRTVSLDDLLEQLRTNNVFDIQDVAFAIVETTGKLSVYQRFEARNVTPQMLNLQSPGEDALLPVAVISDGEVVEDSLRFCNLKPEWLHKVLSENGYQPQDIFLMTCNRKAQYHIIPKEK